MYNELYHHGILGQKWGVRRYENYDGSLTPAGEKRYRRKQTKMANKDAKEYARAKMYYGEGAGNRRKLINATVNERSKDHYYKSAFNEALSKQNMAEHAKKAKSERKRKDTENAVKKTSRGLVNIFTGHPERAGAALAVVAAGVGLLHKTHADQAIVKIGKKKVSEIADWVSTERARRRVAKMFRQ